MTEPGQPCVMISGNAFSCRDSTWMKWISTPSISVVNCGSALSLCSTSPEVVVRHPVARELLQRLELHALRAVFDEFLGGPARRLDAPAHVVDSLLGNLDVEVPDLGGVRRLFGHDRHLWILLGGDGGLVTARSLIRLSAMPPDRAARDGFVASERLMPGAAGATAPSPAQLSHAVDLRTVSSSYGPNYARTCLRSLTASAPAYISGPALVLPVAAVHCNATATSPRMPLLVLDDRDALAAQEPLEAASDPLHDETAVLIGRLLPREVAGIKRVDLAVGQQVGEVLVVGPRHQVVVASGDDRAGVVIEGNRSRSTGFCSG